MKSHNNRPWHHRWNLASWNRWASSSASTRHLVFRSKDRQIACRLPYFFFHQKERFFGSFPRTFWEKIGVFLENWTYFPKLRCLSRGSFPKKGGIFFQKKVSSVSLPENWCFFYLNHFLVWKIDDWFFLIKYDYWILLWGWFQQNLDFSHQFSGI